MTKNNIIKFLLGNDLIIIDFEKQNLSPTTTVLNYLRSLPNFKGVKEGCAEGDCGACTIVIADIINNQIVYKSFDSCLLFLPSLHGKQLITVEHLGNSSKLHPIQQDLIDNHASQCGYCTPGFAMSIFALYKSKVKTDLEEINNSLAGNLCRCTGYRPIIDSAVKSCSTKKIDDFTKREEQVLETLKKIKAEAIYPSILIFNQQYFLPKNVNDALKLKKENTEAIIINGSTDIALRVTKKKELLHTIIDISEISELKEINNNENKLIIGAGTCLEEVRNTVKDTHTALYDILTVFGSRQIRNKATLGGNIASSSPIGDTIPVLLAYEARLVLKTLNSEREIKLLDFITGYRQNVLAKDELIYKVILPFKQKDTIIKSYKISKRKDLDISTVSCSISLKLKNQIVEDIIIVYGGMSAYTKPASNIQNFLKTKTWNKENIIQAMKLIDSDFMPISDARSSAEGRFIMAKNLLLKFYNDTIFS